MGSDIAIVFPRAGVSGGVERVVLELLRFQSERRDVCFVGQVLELSGVAHRQVVIRRLPKTLRPLAFRHAANTALKEVGASTVLSCGANCPPGDVYWVHSVHAAWLANGGDIVLRGFKMPARARRLLLRHQVLLRLERDYFTKHRPRAIICTSQREVDDLHRFYGVSRDITHVVPNGFDAGSFSTARAALLRASARESIGAQDGHKVVLMVANEWHRKGLGTLLEAIARLADPQIHLHLVGQQNPEDYIPVAERLGLSNRLHWHGTSRDVASYYAAADIFALPTTYEPFGLVIIEAMASGLPVVVSALAGAAAAITDGVAGFSSTTPATPTS